MCSGHEYRDTVLRKLDMVKIQSSINLGHTVFRIVFRA